MGVNWWKNYSLGHNVHVRAILDSLCRDVKGYGIESSMRHSASKGKEKALWPRRRAAGCRLQQASRGQCTQTHTHNIHIYQQALKHIVIGIGVKESLMSLYDSHVC